MKTLPKIVPTAEQLVLISDPRAGVQVIRGAAGSGKTTTALLMLKQLSSFWLSRKKRLNLSGGVNILVVTFNRTLRGYILDLAEREVPSSEQLNLTVVTFGKLAMSIFPEMDLINNDDRESKIRALARNVPLPVDFVADEVDYIFGRFPTGGIEDYLTCRRIGRGKSPRVDRGLRKRLIDEVVNPYQEWKSECQKVDWNDMAVLMVQSRELERYDVIVADESQDFSANQVRAIMNCAADPASVIFVMDAAQRIYPRGFQWTEVGISNIKGHRLKENHRNTTEICRFAAPLLNGLDVGDDGAIPDLNSCKKHGPVPVVVKSRYSKQIDYAINYIDSYIDLASESVGFLHPKGWFKYLKQALHKHSLRFVAIGRKLHRFYPRTLQASRTPAQPRQRLILHFIM
ncbi:MAG TPA: UvrD-helicase domain-containing protein [Sedimentisphaerales bacterium]|nr:UvrD-helicase domain-containing protein [Sedimentisphaerales bacterium]